MTSANTRDSSTFSGSVEIFVTSASSWLSDADAPAVQTLRALAALLDKEPTAALANSFGVAYRALVAREPKDATPALSPLAQALADATNAED